MINLTDNVAALIALTRVPSPMIGRCELTYLPRSPIDYAKAIQQHADYVQTLRQLGLTVLGLPAADDLPDSVFVEDTALVLDEIAIMASPCLSRRGEIDSIRQILKQYRHTADISAFARLEGGDVIRDRRTLYIGQSTRTDKNGLESLNSTLSFYGYRLVPIAVSHCLHLSTAASCLDNDTFLINANWIDERAFHRKRLIKVPVEEPWASNVLSVGDHVVMPSKFPRTCDLLDRHRYKICTVDVSELLKAECGVTCMSLIFDSSASGAVQRHSTDVQRVCVGAS